MKNVVEVIGVNRIFPVTGGEFQAVKDIYVKLLENKFAIFLKCS